MYDLQRLFIELVFTPGAEILGSSQGPVLKYKGAELPSKPDASLQEKLLEFYVQIRIQRSRANDE